MNARPVALGAGVKFMRASLGCEGVVLVGN